MNKDIKAKLNQIYLLGERTFTNNDLSEANLKGINLAGVNLKNSDLSFVNLESANLAGANLSNCNLKGANLKSANLTDAILDDSDLSFSKLNGANLTNIHAKNSNFYQAYLNHIKAHKGHFICANFSQSSLNYSDFSQSNIRKGKFKNAFLTGVDLTQAYLAEANFAGACLASVIIKKTSFRNAQYDQKTLFSRQFDPEKMSMVYQETHEIQVQDLLQVMDCIMKSSQKYLGNSWAKKFLESSKPNNDWMNKFQLDSNGLVSYAGIPTTCLNDFQLQWYRRWVKTYIKDCSIIVNNFDELIQNDLSSLSSVPSELKLIA